VAAAANEEVRRLREVQEAVRLMKQGRQQR